MKNLKLPLMVAAATSILMACNSGTDQKNSADSLGTTETLQNKECFLASQGADTAYLSLGNDAKGKVTGSLFIDSSENPDNKGTFSGEFRGDTLFADYTFTTGESKTVFKNPLALLKKNNQLILGVGEIESYLGRSYFKKGVPINFEISRFKFDAADCSSLKEF